MGIKRDMVAAHIGVLPLHPQPKPYESLTSYLMRLASANRVEAVYAFANLIDLHLAAPSIKADMPPPSWGGLPIAAHITPERLKATTLMTLTEKFGGQMDGQRPSVFFGESLRESLQYCPHCIAEKGCYDLRWRLTCVTTCPQHRCLLLDACGFCAQPIPLLRQPLQIGICPHCRADLREAPTAVAADALREQSDVMFSLLTELLKPTEWNVDIVAANLGRYLANLARQSRLSFEDVAARTQIDIEYLKEMQSTELGVRRGAKFAHYIRYAEYFSVSLIDIFREVAAGAAFATTEWTNIQQQQMVEALDRAVTELQIAGVSLTKKAIAQQMGIYPEALNYYPFLRERLEAFFSEEVRRSEREVREDDLIREALHAVRVLREEGESISLASVARELGRTPEGFVLYPRLRAAIENEMDTAAEREQLLEAKLRQAILVIGQAGEIVTLEGVGRRVGMTPEGLKKYPALQPILDSIKSNYAQSLVDKPQQTLDRVNKAIVEMEAADELITVKKLAERCSISERHLNHFPQVAERIRAVLTSQRQKREEALIQREAQIVADINTAVGAMQKSGIKPTPDDILEQINLSKQRLKRYRRAQALIRAVTNRKRL